MTEFLQQKYQHDPEGHAMLLSRLQALSGYLKQHQEDPAIQDFVQKLKRVGFQSLFQFK